MVRALALVLGPIVCGAVFVLLAAPPETPGAYAVTASGVYPLPGAPEQTCRGDLHPATVHPPPPLGVPVLDDVTQGLTFYVVSAHRSAVGSNLVSARLFFFIGRNGPQAVGPDYQSVPVTVRQANARVHQVVVARFDDEVSEARYRQVLAHVPGSRATLEGALALVVSDHGACRTYLTQLQPSVSSVPSFLGPRRK